MVAIPVVGAERFEVILLQVVVSGLLMGSVYAPFSSGVTLIWGMTNVVNFAHGDFVMLAMYAAFFAVTLLKLGPFFFAPGAAALLFILGVVVYFVPVRHVADAGVDIRHLRPRPGAAIRRLPGV